MTMACRSLFLICVGLYLIQLLTGQDDLSLVCLAPAATPLQLQCKVSQLSVQMI